MSFFADYSPVPVLPKYTGPYTVGTIDVEIPVCDLNQPGLAPDTNITTIAFRIFYPCEPNVKPASIRWLPEPQRGYLSAYAKFMGLQSLVSEIIACFPQLPYYATIPAAPSAPLLNATTESQRWPLMIFSHGLGGTRTAYSHIVGSLASHGIVVVAPEHRDGSATVSYIRDDDGNQAKKIEYKRFPHQASPEVYAGRDEQLRVRLWELSCTYDALLRIDLGNGPRNLAPNPGPSDNDLSMFIHRLDIHTPGSVAFAGHSFGAATVTQFTKSIFWRSSEVIESHTPLITAESSSLLVKQITPSTPLILLDIWTLPLRSPAMKWLWEKPLPCYSAPSKSTPVLSILSEAFFKWRNNVSDTIALLSPPEDLKGKSNDETNRPRLFYPAGSAHLNHSDFGVLFPWLTKTLFKADEPERIISLNVRAILQILRENGTVVADTSPLGREEEAVQEKIGECKGDVEILQLGASIRGWCAVALDDINLDEETNPPEKKTGVEAVIGAEVLKNKYDVV